MYAPLQECGKRHIPNAKENIQKCHGRLCWCIVMLRLCTCFVKLLTSYHKSERAASLCARVCVCSHVFQICANLANLQWFCRNSTHCVRDDTRSKQIVNRTKGEREEGWQWPLFCGLFFPLDRTHFLFFLFKKGAENITKKYQHLHPRGTFGCRILPGIPTPCIRPLIFALWIN